MVMQNNIGWHNVAVIVSLTLYFFTSSVYLSVVDVRMCTEMQAICYFVPETQA